MYGKNKSKMVLQSNYVVVGRALFVALSKGQATPSETP
jgi:hypothetical protein